jgi:methionyl aminopeptidase
MDKSEYESYLEAGKIAKEAVDYAKNMIKPGMPLLEITEKIESKIFDLGGELAFPVNLSIDEVAAHYHPTLEDDKKAQGLLKVDIGVHVDGFIADTAFSIDLTPDNRYKYLINASSEAVENAIKAAKENQSLSEIGSIIQETIQKKGFSPIVNLSGHSLMQYNLHAGITIPNYANGNKNELKEGAYAIEPFATTGEGKVYEGQSSNIFAIIDLKNTRSQIGRKILEYAWEKYKNLPFSLREMQKKFGNMSKISLKQMEQEGIIHNFPQLIEKSHAPVSQAEHTIIINKGKFEVTTR